MSSEPTRRQAEAWFHVRDNCLLARRFAGNLTAEALSRDVATLYAVVRALEIVSEASRRLRGDQQARFPEVDWRHVEDAGNVYRHGYDILLTELIWLTVHEEMGALLTVAEEVCRELEAGID